MCRHRCLDKSACLHACCKTGLTQLVHQIRAYYASQNYSVQVAEEPAGYVVKAVVPCKPEFFHCRSEACDCFYDAEWCGQCQDASCSHASGVCETASDNYQETLQDEFDYSIAPLLVPHLGGVPVDDCVGRWADAQTQCVTITIAN